MRCAVLLSGGLDSTTCLAVAIEKYGKENVECMNVSYGQKHSKEIVCAKNVADYYGVPLRCIDLSEVFKGADCSLLGSGAVPEGRYAEQEKITTLVPFRNGLLLSTLTAMMLSRHDGEWAVVIGVHHDDMAGDAYPDCSAQFITAMKEAIYAGTGGKVLLEAPFLYKVKKDIVAEGLRLKVPYQLTWSCYNGGEVQCGTCATCIDRREAFKANKTEDPLPYDR